MNKSNSNFHLFKLLKTLVGECNISQRKLSISLNWSLGKTNSVIKDAVYKKMITTKYELTLKGLTFLEKFRVDTAIILAAGMSSRFAPFSYETPKSLIKVKGEVMIERIIRQLQEVGIKEIIVVVGYLMHKFLYLEKKFGVKLIANPEYSVKNTHSSINVVKEYLKNSYIICADNYFVENVFSLYEFRPFYGAKYIKEKNFERGFFVDNNNLIIDTRKPAFDQLVMWGHAYFDNDFSQKFRDILSTYYGKNGVDHYYWETIFIENLDKLKMYVKIYNNEEIQEFDSAEELKEFDPDYIKNNNIELINNICSILNCSPFDIHNVEKITGGLSNFIFKFSVNGVNYVYRIPGDDASILVDRNREAACAILAKQMDVDNTLIYIDRKKGWKLSKYIDNSRHYDPNNEDDVIKFAKLMKKMHDNKSCVKSGFEFNYYKNALDILELMSQKNFKVVQNLQDQIEKAKLINDFLVKDSWGSSLCHNDIYQPNVLITENEAILIDWEFAGDNDPGFDIAKIFSLSKFDEKTAKRKLAYYFDREPNDEEYKHILACVCINYFYWLVWSSYMNECGHPYEQWFLKWNDDFYKFYKLFIG